MTLLIGERYQTKLAKCLAELKIGVLWLPDNPALDPRLAGHADLSVFICGNHAVVAEEISASSPHIVSFLTDRGYEVLTSRPQGTKYPQDAGLCVCRTGKYTIFNPKTADPAVKSVIDGTPVAVSQGYTKCAAAVVNDHSIITADSGVCRAAKMCGMDVLLIAPGHITLDGYAHGFIGGASFSIRDDTIAFTGTLDEHPDKKCILEYLAANGQKAVFLSEEPIFDIGGAIPV